MARAVRERIVPSEASRHLSCSLTAALLARVQAHGDGAVEALLQESGSRRSAGYLRSSENWISFGEAASLWEASARVTHDPQVARRAGEAALRELGGLPLATLFRSLGSCEEVYRRIACGFAELSRVSALEPIEVRPGYAEIVARPVGELPRDAHECAWTCGLMAQAPVLFGSPPATVQHDECAALGAPCCRYRVSWGEDVRPDARMGLHDGRHPELEMLRAGLKDMAATARDVTGELEIGEVLERITHRAALRTRSGRALLAVRLPPGPEVLCRRAGMAEHEAQELAARLQRPEGEAVPGSWLLAPVRSSRRDYGYLAAIVEDGHAPDATEREMLETYAHIAAGALDGHEDRAEASHGRARLSHAERLAHLGSWEWDVAGEIIEHSAESLRLFGLHEHAPAMTPREALATVHPDDRARVERVLAAALEVGHPFCYEARIVRGDGQERVLLTKGEVETRAGRPVRIWGTNQDVTERKRLEAQLLYHADHDALTGLFNRRRFDQELARTLRHAARYGRRGALVMIDLDNLKRINDTSGHGAGDEALRACAEAISQRVRSSDAGARLGGDEFAIIVSEADEATARTITEDIRRILSERSTGPSISISAGIALLDGQLTTEQALRVADMALYEAKRKGKDHIRVVGGGPEPRSGGPVCA